MTLKVFEPRSGGRWRYIHKDQDGNEYAFHGVYHEIAAPERIIDTFEFEGLPEKGHVVLKRLNLFIIYKICYIQCMYHISYYLIHNQSLA